ncbi:MAG TPA: hypothetical protein VGV67_07405 [Solirubrobacteraceae bacterium]|nr:hypothetical protein [Solirubrobacteraceae bacterium]
MILCECGEPLVDDIDDATVTVDGDPIPFRRTTDWVACPRCGRMRSVRSLKAEAVATGEFLLAEVAAARTDQPATLQAAAEEAVASIHEATDTLNDDDYADVVLSALSDISREDDASA